MSDLAVIVVGINDWGRYTSPCIASVWKNEPELDIYVVDNGSKEVYPQTNHAKILRLDKTVCYAEAMNMGMDFAGAHMRYLICNNDVLFKRPFAKLVNSLPMNRIVGFYMHKEKDTGTEYMSSWAWIISNHIWLKVGRFDQLYKPMGYEDADYCLRAKKEGFDMLGLMRETFGIEHLSKERVRLPKENLEYLKVKHGL